ncbi:hypothetical protein SARC_07847 [Sphaeroforma arctica JP610]|uniref:nitric oxide dioxygenase n=1 Tax=Sphaeroforma arctica JP610 TaxID=667725 RepID=A0A0L0FSV3_9EUKA|nr:hypothetical protein SARC_07847 [Sphaeroforma arctica JP610]KNC79774.1 hypothetical protein SARC_07847 [Sphaeroforma arctica JP610]|eukprot:XP_014153676.1 hypothetical protein SARC_07847 [Sphaeroforma arctica JP610]
MNALRTVARTAFAHRPLVSQLRTAAPATSMMSRFFHATQAPKAEAPPLSQKTIDIVKSCAPVLEVHGYDIAANMYKRMFANHPEVAELFNPSHQVPNKDGKAMQPWGLSCAVHAYALYIDDLGMLAEAVERIAQKHVSLDVLPEHYGIVGENLLWSIKDTLGDAATPEIMAAWEEAYGFLAWVFIQREETLMAEKANQPGGWRHWRNFVVDLKKRESGNIMSLILKPEDGGPVVKYEPGQYIGIRIENGDHATQRNYSLSSAPRDDYYRLSIKREEAHGLCPAGYASNWVHDKLQEGDIVKLSVPSGDFFLKEGSDKPIVLLSGGVGITPIVAMLDHLVENKFNNHVTMFSAVRNAGVEAWHKHIEEIGSREMNVRVHFLYDEPPNDSYPKGPITIDHLKRALTSKDQEFYFCGPQPFMKQIYNGLTEWGVPEKQIHFEFFGPTQAMQA